MILEKELLQKILDTSLLTGGDFAEVFAEDTVKNSIQLVGGSVETVFTDKVYGVGIRIAKELKSVYGYTNDLSEESLLKLASDLSQSFDDSKKIKSVKLNDVVKGGEQNKIKIYPQTVELEKKIDIMRLAYDEAKNYSPEIVQVRIVYSDTTQHVQIANNSGKNIEDERVYTRMYIMAIASDGKVMQTGGEGPGAHMGFEFFDTIDVKEKARNAAITAVTMLHADECPSGKMTVVIDNGFGGVIFHEACGHSLEATSVAKNASVFCGKLGKKIASDIVSAVDDGTMENEWGSENIDDEGNKQQNRLLIENGILKSYMIDELNSRRMNLASTGSSRRESYKFAPTSRMSNTYICPGKSTFDEIIAATEYGLYAKSLGGGSVDPGSGDFNFAVNEGYIIRDGKIAEPVRGASLVGNGAEVLLNIDMVGNNLRLAQGVCGSASGSVNTNVGQPTIRVKNVTVGGRKGTK